QPKVLSSTVPQLTVGCPVRVLPAAVATTVTRANTSPPRTQRSVRGGSSFHPAGRVETNAWTRRRRSKAAASARSRLVVMLRSEPLDRDGEHERGEECDQRRGLRPVTEPVAEQAVADMVP